MGGYNAGEVASGIAVKTITNLVREGLAREDLGSLDRATGLTRPSIVLRDAITRANKIIYQTARSQAECEGMGTTVVAALFYDNQISIAHVGRFAAVSPARQPDLPRSPWTTRCCRSWSIAASIRPKKRSGRPTRIT